MNIEEMTNDQIAAYAIKQWMNYIQTGDPCLSAEDAQRLETAPKPLSIEQMRGLVRLDAARQQFAIGRLEPATTAPSVPSCYEATSTDGACLVEGSRVVFEEVHRNTLGGWLEDNHGVLRVNGTKLYRVGIDLCLANNNPPGSGCPFKLLDEYGRLLVDPFQYQLMIQAPFSLQIVTTRPVQLATSCCSISIQEVRL